MTNSKPATWPFVLISLCLTVILWLLSWSMDIWLMETIWQPFVAAFLAALASAVIGFILWLSWGHYLRNQPSESERKQQLQFKEIKRNLVDNFHRAWFRTQRKTTDPYATPWYFLINEGGDSDSALIEQMGFERVTTEQDLRLGSINFWASDVAIIIECNMSVNHERFADLIDLMLIKLKSKRPRQAANGVLLTCSVQMLLASKSEHLKSIAKSQRKLVQEFNASLGVNLPLYNIFSQMSGLKDYCESFAALDDQRLEEPFGAMMPVVKKVGFNEQWFNDSFNELEQALTVHISPGLKAQLDQSFRASLVMAPLQFKLLKTEISHYLKYLLVDTEYEKQPLHFRGYFFTSVTGTEMPIDRLAMVMSAELGYSSIPVHAPQSLTRSLFVKQLMRRDILSESHLVGVNRMKESLYGFFRAAFSGGLCVLFVLFIWLLKANFDYYQRLDNLAISQLDSYKQNLLTNKSNRDDLTAPVFSLTELRRISELYDQEKPWYVASWLPKPGIGSEVYRAYRNELNDILLVALRDYLMKDLYVYNKLDDKVKTLELFNLQQLLYNPERKNNKALKDYYIRFLQEEGEGDVATLEHFKSLVDDVLRPGVIPPKTDQSLVELVRKSLSSENLTELLYQHILQQPVFSQHVDMRTKLGQRYRQVFSFDEGAGHYLVPFLFTREGFRQLMTGTGFELANEAIKDYEGVIGRISNENELRRINRKLKQRYVEDYIAYWQNFARSADWTVTSGWVETRKQLSLASDPIFSPLTRLYSLINQQTDLALVVNGDNGSDKKKAKGVKVPGKVGAAAKKLQKIAGPKLDEKKAEQVAERKASALKMAEGISKYFINYHLLVKADEAGQSRLGLALSQMEKTEQWLKVALVGKTPGRFFLDQLANAASENVVAQMSDLSDSFQDQLLQDILSGSAEQVNKLAMSDVRLMINQQWKTDVLNDYKQNIGEFYPFTKDSNFDVSLKSFKAFFGPKGVIESFSDKYLVFFAVREGGYPVLHSFLPADYIALDSQFWHALDSVDDIQQAFYTADKFGLQFAIRTQEMTAGLSELSLRNERPLYSYRNGPSLWKSFSWPIKDSDSWDVTLSLKDLTASQQQFEFEGIWSWFKLSDSLNGKIGRDDGTSVLVAKHGEESAKLLLRIDGAANPFVAGYFSEFQLPSAL